MAMQEPPPVGHSKTFVVAVAGPSDVGEKISLTLQAPGPAKEPLQVSKLKEKGTLIPLPEASSTSYPVSTVIETSRVTVVLIGTSPKSTVAGLADAALAIPGTASAAKTTAQSTVPA